MADWSVLPEGLADLIAKRFHLIEDFIVFRATCKSWREGTTLKDFVKTSCPKLPLLMRYKFETMSDVDLDDNICKTASTMMYDVLNRRNDTDEEHKFVSSFTDEDHKFLSSFCAALSGYKRKHPVHERQLFSLSKGKTCKFTFPEVKGMNFRGSKGWLIMVEHRSCNMCMFHPLTRARIPLPKPPQMVNPFLNSAVLSASPSKTTDYVVMVSFMESGVISGHYVGFWKPGNETWTSVEIPCDVEDLNYYSGKFYALTFPLSFPAQVWMCDASGPASLITDLPWGWWRRKSQLVGCGGRLLVVAPFVRYDYDTPPLNDLEMVEIDVIKGGYNIIMSLSNWAVFLGRNEGFSIDADRFPGIIEPNSIYFSNGSYRVATLGPNHESESTFGRGIWLNF